MCSNTSSGSYGDPNDYSGACLKKQKKEKVPRRGPGVAELEKILREQEKSFTVVPDSSPPFFSPSGNVMDQSIFGPPLPQPPPPPPLRPETPVTALFNGHNSFRPATTNSGGCNLMPSSVSLPEKSPIFPMFFVPPRANSDAIDSRTASTFSFSYFPKDLIPPAPVFHRKQHSVHQVQMMNLPQHVTVPPLTNPPPVGLFQFAEPPSNQRSYPNYASQLLEEDMIVGSKRPRNFLVDKFVDSQMNTKYSVGSTKTTSRDAKQSCSLDLRLKNSIPDYGTTSGNPITVDSPSPATPPTPIQTSSRDFSNSKFTPLTLQENIEDYVQRRKATDVSVNRKPFYSFLTLQSGDGEQTFGMKNEKFEVNHDHGIDLRLKL